MKSWILRCSLALAVTAALLSVVSCSDPGTTYLPASTVYVIGSGDPVTVQYYPIATSSGTATPASTLSLPTGFEAASVAIDVHGQIYVGGNYVSPYQWAILIYPANSTGSATPSRTILLSITSLPSDMAIDASGLLYVATSTGVPVGDTVSVNVYSATASGSATALRTIQVTNATFLSGFAADDAGDVYVAGTFTTAPSVSSAGLAVFSPTASGAATPTRLILPSGGSVSGIATDNAGDIYTEIIPTGTTVPATVAVEEFAPTANGSTAMPVNIINLPTQSAIRITGGRLHLDRTGNLFTSLGLVFTLSPPSPNFGIDGFTPAATGSATPGLSFTPTGAIGQTFAVN